MGQNVRFDGGHKRDSFIVDALSQCAEFIAFCPEHLAFGSPRPSIRMVKTDETLRIISNKTQQDLTQELLDASRHQLNVIAKEDIRAIIFKSKSPTCGIKSSKVYLDNGFAEGKDDGIFMKLCQDNFNNLPMEEEGRLNDPWLRENFIMQLFAYDDFENFKKSAAMKDLIAFHQAYKFLLQSKDEKLYRELGKVVGNQKSESFKNILAAYESLFKQAIGEKSSIGKTRNVLEHMAGFVKNFLDKEEKTILHEQIADYASKIIPVIVPLSTLKIYASKYKVDYLLGQKFLQPYPKELALRSDIRSVK